MGDPEKRGGSITPGPPRAEEKGREGKGRVPIQSRELETDLATLFFLLVLGSDGGLNVIMPPDDDAGRETVGGADFDCGCWRL